MVNFSDLRVRHFAEEIHAEPSLPHPRTERMRPFSPRRWWKAGEARLGLASLGPNTVLVGRWGGGAAAGAGHCGGQDVEPGGPAWHPIPPAVGDQLLPPCSGLLKRLGTQRSAGPRGQVLEASLPRLSARFGDPVRAQNKSATAVIRGPSSLTSHVHVSGSVPSCLQSLSPNHRPQWQGHSGPGDWQEDGESREAQRQAGGCQRPGLPAGITPTEVSSALMCAYVLWVPFMLPQAPRPPPESPPVGSKVTLQAERDPSALPRQAGSRATAA